MITLPKTSYVIRKVAKKGRAVFAREEIEPGTIIGDYVGEIVPDKLLDKKKGLYAVFRNNDQAIFPKDPTLPGVHVINHCCAPNCGFYPFKGHVICATLRRIFPGEELTLHYYLDPPEDNDPTEYHPCFCGHSLCTGTMHANHKLSNEFTWHKMDPKEARALSRKMPAGKTLDALDKYPKYVKDHELFDMYASTVKPPLLRTERKLPSIKVLRKLIRESGKRLKFKNLGLTVLGVYHEQVICKP